MTPPTPTSDTLLDSRFQYGEHEHQHYLTEGYFIFRHFLEEATLRQCVAQIDRMIEMVDDPKRAEEMICTHQLGERWIWDLATETALLDMIERHIGPNIVFWSSHLICKPPRTGMAIPWHQDAPYWNETNLAGGIWIPFDDIDYDNGAMAILPRAHTQGALPRLIQDGKFFGQQIDPAALPTDLEEKKVEYHLRAGQMATHHTMIPHNSVPNTSDRWRRVLVLRFMAADGDMGQKTYSDYRSGAPFERQFYLVRGEDVLERNLPRTPDA